MLAEAQRIGMLAAMGVDVYRPRQRVTPPVHVPVAIVEPSTSSINVDSNETTSAVIVVCAYGVRDEPRHMRLFSQLPQLLGISKSRIGWLQTDTSGHLAAPPPATAYLVLGNSLTRVLGEQLSTKQQMQATIAVTDDGAELARGAAGKRALWQALKPVARALRAGGG